MSKTGVNLSIEEENVDKEVQDGEAMFPFDDLEGFEVVDEIDDQAEELLDEVEAQLEQAGAGVLDDSNELLQEHTFENMLENITSDDEQDNGNQDGLEDISTDEENIGDDMDETGELVIDEGGQGVEDNQLEGQSENVDDGGDGVEKAEVLDAVEETYGDEENVEEEETMEGGVVEEDNEEQEIIEEEIGEGQEVVEGNESHEDLQETTEEGQEIPEGEEIEEGVEIIEGEEPYEDKQETMEGEIGEGQVVLPGEESYEGQDTVEEGIELVEGEELVEGDEVEEDNEEQGEEVMEGEKADGEEMEEQGEEVEYEEIEEIHEFEITDDDQNQEIEQALSENGQLGGTGDSGVLKATRIHVYPVKLSDMKDLALEPSLKKAACCSLRFFGPRCCSGPGSLEVRFSSYEEAKQEQEIISKMAKSHERPFKATLLDPGEGPMDWALNEWQKTISPTGIFESRCVFVNNVPDFTREEMLRALYPTSESINISKNSAGVSMGYAMLEFASPEEADEVVSSSQDYQTRIGDNILKLNIVAKIPTKKAKSCMEEKTPKVDSKKKSQDKRSSRESTDKTKGDHKSKDSKTYKESSNSKTSKDSSRSEKGRTSDEKERGKEKQTRNESFKDNKSDSDRKHSSQSKANSSRSTRKESRHSSGSGVNDTKVKRSGSHESSRTHSSSRLKHKDLSNSTKYKRSKSPIKRDTVPDKNKPKTDVVSNKDNDKRNTSNSRESVKKSYSKKEDPADKRGKSVEIISTQDPPTKRKDTSKTVTKVVSDKSEANGSKGKPNSGTVIPVQLGRTGNIAKRPNEVSNNNNSRPMKKSRMDSPMVMNQGPVPRFPGNINRPQGSLPSSAHPMEKYQQSQITRMGRPVQSNIVNQRMQQQQMPANDSMIQNSQMRQGNLPPQQIPPHQQRAIFQTQQQQMSSQQQQMSSQQQQMPPQQQQMPPHQQHMPSQQQQMLSQQQQMPLQQQQMPPRQPIPLQQQQVQQMPVSQQQPMPIHRQGQMPMPVQLQQISPQQRQLPSQHQMPHQQQMPIKQQMPIQQQLPVQQQMQQQQILSQQQQMHQMSTHLRPHMDPLQQQQPLQSQQMLQLQLQHMAQQLQSDLNEQQANQQNFARSSSYSGGGNSVGAPDYRDPSAARADIHNLRGELLKQLQVLETGNVSDPSVLSIIAQKLKQVQEARVSIKQQQQPPEFSGQSNPQNSFPQRNFDQRMIGAGNTSQNLQSVSPSGFPNSPGPFQQPGYQQQMPTNEAEMLRNFRNASPMSSAEPMGDRPPSNQYNSQRLFNHGAPSSSNQGFSEGSMRGLSDIDSYRTSQGGGFQPKESGKVKRSVHISNFPSSASYPETKTFFRREMLSRGLCNFDDYPVSFVSDIKNRSTTILFKSEEFAARALHLDGINFLGYNLCIRPA